jgi:hypothetical protein
MASLSQELALGSFANLALLESLRRAYDPATADSAKAHARILALDAALWLSVGSRVGYFDGTEAQRMLEASALFNGHDDFRGEAETRLAPTGWELLDRIRDGSLLSGENNPYNDLDADAFDVLSRHVQTGTLLVGRCMATREGIASDWCAALMHGTSEEWEALMEAVTVQIGNADNVGVADDALSVLRYMDGGFEAMNAAASDERLNEYVQQQLGFDLATALSWPLNLESDTVRSRFKSYFDLVISDAERLLTLDEQHVYDMGREIERLSDDWGELARGRARATATA